MFLKRADKPTEDALLEKVVEVFGDDRGIRAYYKMQDDGTPVVNQNGRRAMAPLTDEEVSKALRDGIYLFVLN